jgi:hypothetical protein
MMRSESDVAHGWAQLFNQHRHPGEGRDLAGALGREVETPAFAGVTKKG